jgi:hypothetical protein
MPRLPSPPAPLPQAGEGRIRSRIGRCRAPECHPDGAATPDRPLRCRSQRPRDPPHIPRGARLRWLARSAVPGPALFTRERRLVSRVPAAPERAAGLCGGYLSRCQRRCAGRPSGAAPSGWQRALRLAPRTRSREQSAKADFGPSLPRIHSPRRGWRRAPLLPDAPNPEGYPLAHAVCGRGWHACQRGRVRAPRQPGPRAPPFSLVSHARKTHRSPIWSGT